MSVRNIQVFLGFANFYQHFIQQFSKIAAPLTSILKTTFFPTNVKKLLKATGNSNFLTPKAKLAFLQLKKVFTKAPILPHFHPQRYIRIEIDASDYTISSIFSQLTLESSQ